MKKAALVVLAIVALANIGASLFGGATAVEKVASVQASRIAAIEAATR